MCRARGAPPARRERSARATRMPIVSLALADALVVNSAINQQNAGASAVIRVTGSVSDTPAEPALLQLTTMVNGSPIRTQLEQLCRLRVNVTSSSVAESVLRRCEYAGEHGVHAVVAEPSTPLVQ